MKVHWGWSRQILGGWRQNWQSYCWLWQNEGALRLKQIELGKVTAELTELLLIVTEWRCIEVEADRAWEGDGRTDRAIVDCDRMKVHWGWSRQSLGRWRQNWQSYCWLWQNEGALRLKQTELGKVTAELTELLLVVTGWRCSEVEADRAWEGDGRTDRAIVDCDRMKMHWGWSRQSLRRWRQNWQLLLIVTGWRCIEVEADRAWEGDGRTDRAIVDCDRMKVHWGWSRQSLRRWRQNWQSYCWLWQDEGALRLKQTELGKVTAELTELLLIVTGWRCIEVEADRAREGDGRTDRAIVDCDRMKVHWGWSRQSLGRWRQNWQSYCWLWQDEADRAWEGDGRTDRAIVDCDRMKQTELGKVTAELTELLLIVTGWRRQGLRRWRQNWQSYCWLWQDDGALRLKQTELEKVTAELTELLLIVTGLRCIEVEADRAWEGDGRTDRAIVDCDRMKVHWGWSRQSLRRWWQNWQSYCWLWQDEGALRLKQTELERVTAELTVLLLIVTGWRCIEVEADRAREGDGRTDRAIVDCDRMKVHWGWSRQSLRGWRQNWQSYCWLWQDEDALRLKQTELERVTAELTELLLIVTGWRCIEVEADRAREGDGRTDSYCWLWQDEGALRLKQTELEKVTAELTELLLIVTGWRCIEVEADRAWEGDGRTDRAIVDCDRMKMHWGWSRQSSRRWRQNWQSYCWLWQDEGALRLKQTELRKMTAELTELLLIVTGWSRQSLGRWRQNWQSYCWLWQDEADRAWEGDGRTDRAIVDCDRMKKTGLEKVTAELTELLLIVTGWWCIEVEADRAREGDGRTDRAIVDCDRMKMHWGWSRQSLRRWRQNWQSYCWLWQDEGALRLKQTELEKVMAELTELLLIVTGWRCIEVEADRAWEGDGRTDSAIVDCDRMKMHWGWSRQSLRRWRQNWQSYCWLWQDEGALRLKQTELEKVTAELTELLLIVTGWRCIEVEADRAWEGDGRTDRAIVDCDRMKVHWGWSRQSLRRWRQNWQSYCWLWQDEGALRLKQTELEKVTAELTELLLIVTGWRCIEVEADRAWEGDGRTDRAIVDCDRMKQTELGKVTAELTELLLIVTGWRCIEVEADRAWEGDGRTDRAIVDCDRMKVHWGWSRQSLRRWRQNWQSYCWLWQDEGALRLKQTELGKVTAELTELLLIVTEWRCIEVEADRAWEGDGRTDKAIVDCDRMKVQWGWSRQSLGRWRQNWQSYCWLWQDEDALRLKQTELEKVTAELTELLLIVTGWRCIEVEADRSLGRWRQNWQSYCWLWQDEADRAWEGDGRTDRAIVDCDRMKQTELGKVTAELTELLLIVTGWRRQGLRRWRQNWQSYCWLWQDEGALRLKQTELEKVTAELTELLLIVTGWRCIEVEADRAWEGDGRTDRAIVDCDRMKVHWGWSRQSLRGWRQNWQCYCWLWQDEDALRLKQTELEKVTAELTELLLIVTGWRCIEVEADRAWEGDGRTDRAIVDCDRMKVHWGWSRQSLGRWRQNWQSYCWLWQDEGALRLKQTELGRVTAELTELLLIVTGWSRQSLGRWRQN